MQQEEYLDNRLKRDFIRYTLLQKPVFSEKEVSAKLRSEIDIDRLYRRMKGEIEAVCDRHLGLRRLTEENGEITNILPDWLTKDIITTIADDFRNAVASHYAAENFMPAILDAVERLTWRQGVDDMAANLRRFIADLRRVSRDYAAIPVTTPDEFDLQTKYEAAKRITVRERIMQDNSKDIIAFRGALLDYAHNICEIVVYRQLSALYADIASSSELTDLVERFERIHTRAEEELKEIERKIADGNAEWDACYNRIVPVEFYGRNVEDISPSMSFHMIVLQALARNEDALRADGYLTLDGRLHFFTNRAFDGLRWLTTDLTAFLLSR